MTSYVLILNMTCKNHKSVLVPEDELNKPFSFVCDFYVLNSPYMLDSGEAVIRRHLYWTTPIGIPSLCHFLYEAVPDLLASTKCPF